MDDALGELDLVLRQRRRGWGWVDVAEGVTGLRRCGGAAGVCVWFVRWVGELGLGREGGIKLALGPGVRFCIISSAFFKISRVLQY